MSMSGWATSLAILLRIDGKHLIVALTAPHALVVMPKSHVAAMDSGPNDMLLPDLSVHSLVGLHIRIR